MREVTTTTKVYTYDELSDDAKERVREWWSRVEWEGGSAQESMQMIWEETLTDAGWENLTGLEYSDLYSQGSGVTWTGDLPTFEFGDRTWYVTVRVHRGGGDDRWMDVSVSETADDIPEEEEAAAQAAAREHVYKAAQDLFWKFRAESEHIASDESVREACEANEYEFTERGDPA